MGDRVPGIINPHNKDFFIDKQTMCRAESCKPQITGSATREVILYDKDACQCRKISTSSMEFRRNYIDFNIIDVDYWSTPYAAIDKKYRNFWVNYCDGRRLKFTAGTIPVRFALPKSGGRWARNAPNPQRYTKKGGFIFPEFYGDGSIPTLIDIATTIAYNHRQREKFLEIAELTFIFSVILTAHVGTPTTKGPPRPRGTRLRFSSPKTTLRAGDALAANIRAKGGRVGVNLGGKGEAPWESYININNLSDGIKPSAISNLIKGNAENIALYFKPGSVDHVVANNIISGSINWTRAAKASYMVLKNGGMVEFAEFGGGTAGGIKKIVDALKAVGFKNVEILHGIIVRGVK